MTNYIILALCVVIILSYLFDITSKYSNIPGVILLIGLGIGIQILAAKTSFQIPNLKPVLPVIGTLGLILIVMEASMDIKLEKRKIGLIKKSIASAIVLPVIFVPVFSYILIKFYGIPVIDSLLNAIPLAIISSAVAISSANNLNPEDKEFIVYESSISDIVGILAFDFILINQASIGRGLINFAFNGVITIFIAIIITSGLAILLHKTRYHVNYVIIMTSVVLVYILAKLSHLPALFLVLVFGLAMSNNSLVEHTFVKRYVDFDKFRKDLDSFKKILGELTFIVKSFFFLLFGYYTKIESLFNLSNILTGLYLVAGIIVLRWIFFRIILKFSNITIVLFAPRGLITILLFLSIPSISRIPFINEEVITLIILFSMAIMMIGNLFYAREKIKSV